MKFDFTKMEHHAGTAPLVEALASTANTSNLHFARTIMTFYLGIVTSTNRVTIQLAGDRPVPLNIYAIGLAESGMGKGVITSAMEELLTPLSSIFLETWREKKQAYMINRAADQAQRNGTEPDEELATIEEEMEKLGEPFLWFTEGTSPAFKQMRSALVKIPYGSLNYIVDEIFNKTDTELMENMVESYDVGELKQKLIKHTADNPRVLDRIGARVPAQMLLFGTGDQLNNPMIQDAFIQRLVSGLGRRSLYSYSPEIKRPNRSAKERLDALETAASSKSMAPFQAKIGRMADPHWEFRTLTMSYEDKLFLMEYQVFCETRADGMEHGVLATEITHRYMKVVKTAGIMAVYDGEDSVTRRHLEGAMKFVEEGGSSLRNMVKIVPMHIRLAVHIAKSGRITMSQLVLDIPWFGSRTIAQKKELLQLATEYGYANNIIIKTEDIRGIQYIQGTMITPTKLDAIRIAISDRPDYNYQNGYLDWSQIHTQLEKPDLYWSTHHLREGNRHLNSIEDGFNLLVIDIDNDPNGDTNIPISMAQSLLNGVHHCIAEHGDSTEEHSKFSVIFPTSHFISLDEAIYEQFTGFVYEWLPFPVNAITSRSALHVGEAKQVLYAEGSLLPVLNFIPDTDKQIAHSDSIRALSDLSNVDRWYVTMGNNGSRVSALYKYATFLTDAGAQPDHVANALLDLNVHLTHPLPSNHSIFN